MTLIVPKNAASSSPSWHAVIIRSNLRIFYLGVHCFSAHRWVRGLPHLQEHVTLVELIMSLSLLSSLWKHLCLFSDILWLYVLERNILLLNQHILSKWKNNLQICSFCKFRCSWYDTSDISRWNFESFCSVLLLSAFCRVCVLLSGCHLQILRGSHATGTFSGVFPVPQTWGTLFPPCLCWAISGALVVFLFFLVCGR